MELHKDENYAIDNTHYVTDSWENEDTVKILPDTKAFGQEINEIFKNGVYVSPNNDERTKEMSDVAPKIMDDLTDENVHVDSVNWVSYDGNFVVRLLQDYENSNVNVGEKEDTKTLSHYSSKQIEYARVWLQLGPNQDIDELNVRHIPAGTLLNPDDDINVSYPVDVIQLRGSRIVDGIVTYSVNGDDTINVYNVPYRWYGGFPPLDDIDKDKVREDMEDIIRNKKLVYVDPGDAEEIMKLIKLLNVYRLSIVKQQKESFHINVSSSVQRWKI